MTSFGYSLDKFFISGESRSPQLQNDTKIKALAAMVTELWQVEVPEVRNTRSKKKAFEVSLRIWCALIRVWGVSNRNGTKRGSF